MLAKNRPDSLLLFLIFSLVLIISIFPLDQFIRKIEEKPVIVNLKVAENLGLPAQGFQRKAKTNLQNRDLQIELSLNGGDDFDIIRDNNIDLLTLKNSKILYRSTSIKWLQPKGRFSYLHSFVLRLRDKKRGELTENFVFTYFDSLHTNLPIISINIKESSLLGWTDGLMTYGIDGNFDHGFNKEWWYRKANFTRRGAKAETVVQFQFFEKGELKIDQTCKFKISGNATRYFPQKSFRLSPLDKDDDKFKYPFWGDRGNKKSKSIVIRNSGNDNTKTIFADRLMQTLAYGDNVLTQQGRATAVYINGNYWGVYNLRERIDQYFIAKHIHKKRKDITILETGAAVLKDGSGKEKDRFDKFIKNIENENVSKQNQSDSLLIQNVNLDNFFDYIFYETFFANNDWPYNNSIIFSSKGSKWSWVLNDLDFSLAYPGKSNLDRNLFEVLQKSGSITAIIFRSVLNSTNLKSKFIKRAKELLNEKLTDKFIRDTFMNLKAEYAKDIEFQINRWRNIGSFAEWEANCQDNLNFLLSRKNIYIDQLNSL